MEDIFKDTVYGQIALKKLAPVAENFMLYEAGWLGDGVSSDVMEVKGAEFRKAKTGKNKGQLSILIKGSERTVYVTSEEIVAASD